MRGAVLHLILCVVAMGVPLVADGSTAAAPVAVDAAFPGWPGTFEGRALTRLPAQPDDALFVADDPGARVARFTDGRSVVLVRWSPAPTRHLHPSFRCFRAVGWEVTQAPRFVDPAGHAWTAYTIEREGRRLRVRERVEDASGRSWADPADWFWAGLLGDASGPAFAYTVSSPER